MDRITTKRLDAIVATLNKVTGNPEASYTKAADGTYKANPGNYHISGAYGGVKLEQISSEGGGVTDPLSTGYISKRALYDTICAFMRGIQLGKEGR